MRRLFTTLLGIAVLGALVWTQRVAILDWIVDMRKTLTVPEAVTYEEVVEDEQRGQREPASAEASPFVKTSGDRSAGRQGTDGTEDETSVILTPSEVEGEGSSPVGQASPEAVQDDDTATQSESPAPSSQLPTTFNLAVPFTPQAPNADWSQPYQDACEEASIYMVHRYYDGDPAGWIDAQTADAGILDVVNFENVLFGFFKDTTAVQTAIVAEQMYGYERVDVLDDPTVEEIKTHIAAGRPVIVPAAGQQLGNPYFTPPGPVYHMLVIKGYTEDGFITNDPGTYRGENYVYDFDVLMNAVHDWNDGDVANGEKVAIVIYPNE